jgi:hypothetical protein
MIGPLLERFDPARRPLLFSCGILARCASRRRSGSIVQIWLLRHRQFARTLLNRRKHPSIAFGDCGILRMEYHDTVSTTPFLVFAVPRGAAAPFAATARFATVGNWTARRR